MSDTNYTKFLRASDKQRIKIRSLSGRGFSLGEIASRVKLSRQRIWQILNPLKHSAHKATQRAVSLGRLPHLSRQECKDCGAKAVEYDHPDYSRPLDVDPVCKECHGERTARRKRNQIVTKRKNGHSA